MARLLLAAAVLLIAGARAGNAADIVILNMDGAGEGFNDPTPVAPVGGNTGTTVGQQRLIVFQEAADVWGALLPSDVAIRVEACFDPLPCSSSSAYLGFAGTLEVFMDFPGAKVPGTWYHVALANKLAGVDLSSENDIGIYFNSDIDDNDDCLGSVNWYYGLDGNEGSDVELLRVVLHELAHGLGFTTFVDNTNGQEFMGIPDIYETFVLDNSTGLHWDDMSDAQRQASALNSGNVVWDGPNVTALSDSYLTKTPIMVVNSPPALPDTIPLAVADFGPSLTTGGVTGNVVLVDDGVGTTSDACEPIINGTQVAGNIALIDRASCSFPAQAQAAEAAGATAAIIVNSGSAIQLWGLDPGITIPVVSASESDGDAIKAELGAGVNVTLKADPSRLLGADGEGRVQLHAPGSGVGPNSISHWARAATPDLLMEPSIYPGPSTGVDLTLPHFADLGWVDIPTGISEGRATLFANLTVLPNHPNPFNPRTKIRYAIPRTQSTRLSVHDVRGRLVRSFAERVEPAGIHEVTWEGRDDSGRLAASGVYFVRVSGEGSVARRKIVLLQ